MALEEMRQPVKKRQRKLDQVLSFEARFLYDMENYKRELEEAHTSILKECEAQFQEKMRQVREEFQLQVIQREEELVCKMNDYIHNYYPIPSSPEHSPSKLQPASPSDSPSHISSQDLLSPSPVSSPIISTPSPVSSPSIPTPPLSPRSL